MGISNIPTSIFFNIDHKFFNSTGNCFFYFLKFKDIILQVYKQDIHCFIFRNSGIQSMLVQPVALPHQPFHPVAFHRPLEALLGNTYRDTSRGIFFPSWIKTKYHSQGIAHETLPRGYQFLETAFTTQAFLFTKRVFNRFFHI